MQALTYTEVRKNFTKTMNDVCDNHSPVIVTRQKSSPVVMMSLEDYNAIQETLYLVSSPNNAKLLTKAMEDFKNGAGVKRNLLDLQ